MKFYLKFCVIASLVVLSSCSDSDDAVPATLEAQIDSYLELNLNQNEPGLSIAIRHEESVVYQRSAGLSRTEGSHAINNDTQFRIGSISKPITALAVMQLVENGQISLNDRLVDILQGLPTTFSNITVEHLLSHRSGLLDYIDDNSSLASLDNLKTSELLGFINGSGLENLEFVPGTSGDYSNTGYVLLALIVEEIAGKSFPAYLEESIFKPLNMNNTFVIHEGKHLGDAGNNYALSFGNNIEVRGFNSLIYGASGVASTTSDLMLLVEGILNYDVVTKETLEIMITSRGSLPGIADYGLGWLTGTGNYWHTAVYSDPNDFWHTGGFDGYQTVMSINPDLNLEVVILTNNGQVSWAHARNLLAMTRDYVKNN